MNLSCSSAVMAASSSSFLTSSQAVPAGASPRQAERTTILLWRQLSSGQLLVDGLKELPPILLLGVGELQEEDGEADGSKALSSRPLERAAASAVALLHDSE